MLAHLENRLFDSLPRLKVTIALMIFLTPCCYGSEACNAWQGKYVAGIVETCSPNHNGRGFSDNCATRIAKSEGKISMKTLKACLNDYFD